MRGTLLNTATVGAGAVLGLLVGRTIPAGYQDVALNGIGLVTCGIGLKMFLQGRNPLVSAVAISLGGILGLALGLHAGIESFAIWARSLVGSGDSRLFVDGLVTSFVLFCVGPMTLLGCIEDALEGKIDLVSVKSTMDGICAVFLAATAGAGVLVTALLLFLFQSGITLAARPLRAFAQDAEALAETSAVGGAVLFSTGLGLLGITDLHNANYLPAIVIAPLMVVGARRFRRTRGAEAS
jgi:uncharacterized membrane protein YqgA involved in biofilm formation